MALSQLLQNEEILEGLLAGLDQGILLTQLDGHVSFANDAVRELLEIPDERPIVSLTDVGGVNLKLAITRGLIERGFVDAVSRRQQGIVTMERWFDLPSGRRCLELRTGIIERPRGSPVRLVLLRDVTDLKRLREASGERSPPDFITRDPQMREVLRQLDQVAPTEAYVLLQGESGTGKNVLARQLHRLSPRKARPLIEVNCAAIPSELLESEFFGHVRGAFTGATSERIGRFAAAHGGTLFLDEVGEVPLHLQAKFLKAVQEQSFEPVGSNKSQTVDVRIVSASNRNLKDAVEARQFRADLYYRLSVITLHVPPLRARKADIPLLIDHFLDRLVSRGYGRAVLAPEALRRLLDYPWPGNVRELENAMEHALICAVDGVIRPESLPQDVRDYPAHGAVLPLGGAAAAANPDQHQRGQILFALKRCDGNKTAAAKMLGIDRVTLWRRMRKLGLG
ncbi:sigma-54 interaction domain-containing protein [Pelomicrobium sp.]|jgi:transcriptional regulator with PAS, ATPase and Fis domain|uniref:sigma-54 interaction domain-containing protein n=1 Tax=Pelomicrobium sp. TaxID=2815319 RepID=UPI002FDD5220